MEQDKPLADLGIQIQGGKLETWNNIEESEVIAIISKRIPTLEPKLREYKARLSAIHQDILTDPDKAVEFHMLAQAQARTDELLNCDLRGLSESEKEARIGQYHRYSSVGSVLLYQHTDFRGSWKFFTATWPNFSWWPYKFNDTVSSGRAWGANILFEHTWYRGRRLWMIGYPYFEIRDFKKFAFNDIASSMMTIG